MVVIKYKKKDEGIFFSHLNVIRISGIDVVDGPHARKKKMLFSGPTSVGVESEAEYVLLTTDLEEHEVENAIENNLPKWIELVYVKEVDKDINLLCDCAEYKVEFDDYKSCKGRIREFFSRDKIEIDANVHGVKQKLDVKDRVYHVKLGDEGFSIVVGIGNNSGHVVELVKSLLVYIKSRSEFEIKKTRQFLRRDGKWVDLDASLTMRP